MNAVGPIPMTTQQPVLLTESQTIEIPEIGQRRPEIQGSQVERLWEEIGGVKTMMSNIAGEKVEKIKIK